MTSPQEALDRVITAGYRLVALEMEDKVPVTWQIDGTVDKLWRSIDQLTGTYWRATNVELQAAGLPVVPYPKITGRGCPRDLKAAIEAGRHSYRRRR